MNSKKLKKVLLVLLAILSITVIFITKKIQIIKSEEVSTSTENKKIKIAIVFDGGGLGDKSFNDLTYDGILRAQQEFGIEFDYAEPRQVKDYEKNLREFASGKMHDLIIAVGPEQEEAIKEISKDYPNQKFTLLDSELQLPNLSSIYTRWQEQTFLNGVIAGMLIDKESSDSLAKAGVVVGKDVKHLMEGAIGFEAGVRYVNKNIDVVVSSVGAFDNPLKAREISFSMYGKGVEYIQHIAGESGLGVFSAANELDKYAFGIDANQNFFDPNNIVATSIRNINEIVFQEIKHIYNNNWESGVHITGFKENSIDITREGSEVLIPKEIMIEVEKLKSQIINGELVIPTTKADLENWVKVNNYKDKK